MVQIIQENKRPSFGQKFSNAVGVGLDIGSQMMQQNEAKKINQQANQMASELLGFDTSGLDPKAREQLIIQAFKQQGAENLQSGKFKQEAEALRGKKEEQLLPLQGAMDTLNRMKVLRKKGNLGIGSTYSPFEGTRREAGEYEQLGKSLIQYATNIPIRNRIEFETLAENLYDPTITDAKAEGILNAMERIIKNSLESSGEESMPSKSSNDQRPALSSFRRG
jgi:hypothetical protein